MKTFGTPLILAMLLGSIALADVRGSTPPTKLRKTIKPVSVCQVLKSLRKFNGKSVAVLGRLDCGYRLIDHTCFLAEDQCERPVKTQGYVWPTKIFLVDWEEGMPRAAIDNPRIESAYVLQKLGRMRETTRLGFHKELRFKQEGNSIKFDHMADVKDQWGVAYGRVFTPPRLQNDDCDDDDIACGGFDGAPVALIMGSLQTYDESGTEVRRTPLGNERVTEAK